MNTAWNVITFRAGLVRALRAADYDVIVASNSDDYVEGVRKLGCRFESVPIQSNGTNPFKDVWYLFRILLLLKREKPKAVLAYTVKPNIFGSIACDWMRIPVINNIAGLGIVFGREGLFCKFVTGLYRFALRRSHRVFFQNNEDMMFFVEGGIVRSDIVDRLPGSGIDLIHYCRHATSDDRPANSQGYDGCRRFVLIARLLWDKGVAEYVEAARIVRAHYSRTEFTLVGFLDPDNPVSVSEADVKGWVEEGIVKYAGVSNDIRNLLCEFDVVVLPSYYREGVPRILLEAAAMGMPIIAADSVGCRDAVQHGVNGLLCRPRDAIDLANKMQQLIKLSSEQIAAFGRESRKLVEQKFDEKLVVSKYFDALNDIANKAL